ncbi:hypothetical protein ACFL02_09080, partial [Planctomycetota bacterium]
YITEISGGSENLENQINVDNRIKYFKIQNPTFKIITFHILPILTFRPMSAPSGSVNCVK